MLNLSNKIFLKALHLMETEKEERDRTMRIRKQAIDSVISLNVNKFSLIPFKCEDNILLTN